MMQNVAAPAGGTLQGKIALITGGSRGIGRAIALRYAREGAAVVVHYNRNTEAAQSLEREITDNGGQAFLASADLATLRGVETLFESLDAVLRKHCGTDQFDILVNNAAIAPRTALEDTTEAIFDEVFAVNVKAPFFIVQQALPRLREGGRIINVSSVVTRIGYPAEAPYSMTKGALNTLTLLLAKQLGPRGVTVNSLSPGVIDTDMNAQMLSAPAARQYCETIAALGRIGTPEDVADAAAFLASPDSRWVTGQCLDVSGGSFIG
nr:glucose 1-dehydrogenase [Capsulimonas corticalis]